ncbi:MAG: NAD(P)-dependent glycerol-3-phosphate dehydrogenase [Actinobacteria bacterium]|nr:NAD(P)-dependent glycerol-3-phosphate dehydrogenase [Actinomycetota bacterium]
MLAQKDYEIKLWARRKECFEEIKNKRINSKYTGNTVIPQNVIPNNDTTGFLNTADFVIFAVPSHVVREIAGLFFNEFIINAKKIKGIISAVKGLEIGTDLRMSQVLKECLPENLKNKISVLSGPNISSELLNKLPGVSVIASLNCRLLEILQPMLSTEYFRVYTNTDIIGVEISGAVKNIIAIAAGISDGLNYGANTKASLITRGLYELTKIGTLLGAKSSTFAGVAGMGDLIATCISKNSRNRMVGEKLALGNSINDIINGMYMIAEGINTSKAVYEIAREKNIDVPITQSVYNILYKGLNPLESVKELMSRKFKPEL